MDCNSVDLGNGATGIFCSRGRGTRKTCSSCQVNRATRACDFPLEGAKKGKTCDRDLCSKCAVKVGRHEAGTKYAGDSLDFCPAHAKQVASSGGVSMRGKGT